MTPKFWIIIHLSNTHLPFHVLSLVLNILIFHLSNIHLSSNEDPSIIYLTINLIHLCYITHISNGYSINVIDSVVTQLSSMREVINQFYLFLRQLFHRRSSSSISCRQSSVNIPSSMPINNMQDISPSYNSSGKVLG
jgi:hypothetical protein